MMKKTKRFYEQPVTRVIELQSSKILAVSGNGQLGAPGNYGYGGDPFNP